MTSNTPLRAINAEASTPAHTRRRGWTPEQKLRHLFEYETACETGEGAAYLRREGIYKSAVYEWRKQRDAGILDGKQPGEKMVVPRKNKPRSPDSPNRCAVSKPSSRPRKQRWELWEKRTRSWNRSPRARTPHPRERHAHDCFARSHRGRRDDAMCRGTHRGGQSDCGQKSPRTMRRGTHPRNILPPHPGEQAFLC